MIQIGSLTFTPEAVAKLGLEDQSKSINAFDVIREEGSKFLKEKFNASVEALSEFDSFMSERSDIYHGVKSAITAPERAYQGKFDPFSPEGTMEALNVAGVAVTGGIPGGAVGPGSVGIISGPKGAKTLGIEKAVRKAKAMHELGYSQNIIARKSAEHFSMQGNPKGIQSLYIGPDGEPRIVLSNKEAKLKKHEKVFEGNDYVKFKLKEGESIPLKDLLDFDTLYELSPRMAEAKVVYDPWVDIFSPGTALGYNPETNTIQVGTFLDTPNRLRNDPSGNLLEGLLHEAGHGIQIEQGTRTGTADRLISLRNALDEAKAKGSFKDEVGLQEIEQQLNKIESGKLPEKEKNDLLYKLYKSNYGEFEARAGSEYAETTFPMTYGKDTW